MSPPPVEPSRYQKALKRGAFFNFIGGIARLAQPLSALIVTWAWGPSLAGLYLLGQSMVEIVSGGIAAGYADATTIFASRHVDGADREPSERRALYRVLTNTLALTAGVSLLVALASLLVARPLITRTFQGYEGLLPGLYLLAFSLVPRAAGLVAIAATKAVMHMEHDAFLNGLVHPVLSLSGFAITYFAGGELTALFGVQLVVESVVALLAMRAFGRYFSLRELGAALREFEFDRQLLTFAIPQSLNLTFNRYITRLDSIMLASFGLGQVDLAYFGTAAFLTGNLGQIRTIFSGAVAPVLARHHARGERAAFELVMGQIARWAASLVVPTIFLVIVLRRDILQLISAEFGADSQFVNVLLIPAFTNCAYGMAGACLMFTGHTRMTLTNSFAVALLNTLFTYLLIPRYGMLGAACATAIATTIMSLLQMIELWKLEQVKIAWSAVWKPHVGLLAGLLVLAMLGDPVRLPPIGRAATAVGLCLGYFLLMIGLRHEELRQLVRGEPTTER